MSMENYNQERREDYSPSSVYVLDHVSPPPRYEDIRHSYSYTTGGSDRISKPPEYSDVINEGYCTNEKY